MTETHNVLSHPTGVDCQLLAGEGTYVLRDELRLATPPPHPSEAPQSVQNINPLAPISTPAAGTKLSLTVLTRRKSPALLYKINTAKVGAYSIKERTDRSSDVSADTPTSPSTDGSGFGPHNKTPPFGDGNPSLLIASGKDKRRKPKSSIQKSNSSYISRVILNESLSKWLQERNADGLLAFANVNRAFEWLDLSSDTRKADYLTKILFTKGHALCHDVNNITKSSGHLDVVIGCSTGDIIWYEPMSQKYGRINKNGLINSSSVVDIRWIPRSENLFLAAHADGSLIVYDKEKEDAIFTAEESRTVPVDSPMSLTLHVDKSVNSLNQKFNPVSLWKLPCQSINAFAISPDHQHLAVVSEDGDLRIIDYLKERLLNLYTSYYGGLTCVCWSPDGKFVCSGGQDDTISIWSFAERRLLARCQGHHSWVTSVSFDPWRCDEHNYRFGSVGEDCRLLLWDFNVGMLHRPKAASVRQCGSIVSHVPLSLSSRYRADSLTSPLRSSSIFTTESIDGENLVVHAVEPRANTAVLPPVMSKIIDSDPLCWLGFEEDCIITSSVNGHIRTWDRPKESGNDSQVTLSASGSNP